MKKGGVPWNAKSCNSSTLHPPTTLIMCLISCMLSQSLPCPQYQLLSQQTPSTMPSSSLLGYNQKFCEFSFYLDTSCNIQHQTHLIITSWQMGETTCQLPNLFWISSLLMPFFPMMGSNMSHTLSMSIWVYIPQIWKECG